MSAVKKEHINLKLCFFNNCFGDEFCKHRKDKSFKYTVAIQEYYSGGFRRGRGLGFHGIPLSGQLVIVLPVLKLWILWSSLPPNILASSTTKGLVRCSSSLGDTSVIDN